MSDLALEQEFGCDSIYSQTQEDIETRFCCNEPTLGDKGRIAWREIMDNMNLMETLEINDEDFMELINVKPTLQPLR